jgi:predicted TPR repeat methyltransferase
VRKLDKLVQKGLRAHQAGNLEEAEATYRKVLMVNPDHADANHFLGVIAFQSGMLNESLELIAKAIGINPENAHYRCNLGNTLQKLGRLEEAFDSHRNALSLSPKLSESHNSMGTILKEKGLFEDAVACFEKAVIINPGYAMAHNNLGISLRKLGKLDEAVTNYQKAIANKPDYVDAHNNLGNALKDLGRLDEALESYRRALEIDPGLKDVRHLISSISGETTDRAPEKYIRQLFDDYAERFDGHLTDTLGYKIPALMRQTLDAVANGPETFSRALDLGCGTGMVAENFLDKTGEIDGIDLSPKMLELAEAKGVYANLYLTDVLEFLEGSDVRPAGYDLILSADTFIYIGRLDRIFAATRDALSDGGLFVFSVEHLEEGDFKLLPSSRYSQSDAYIEKLAAENKFEIVCLEPVVVRVEKDVPIPGRIFVLRVVV